MIEEFTFGVRPWTLGRVPSNCCMSELYWIDEGDRREHGWWSPVHGWILGVDPMNNPLKCYFYEASFFPAHQEPGHAPENYLGGIHGVLSEDWELVELHGVSMPDQDPMPAPMHHVVVLEHMLPRMRELMAAAWEGISRDQRRWMMRCRREMGHRLASEECRRMLPARTRR